MATDVTRDSRFCYKKAQSHFAAEIKEAEIDTFMTDGTYTIVNLPPNALILDAFVFVKTASDATTATVALGTTDGGAEIMAATSLTATGEAGTLVAVLDTGAGQPVYATFASTGSPTGVADYVLNVRYLEYTKNTGDLTRVSNAPA